MSSIRLLSSVLCLPNSSLISIPLPH